MRTIKNPILPGFNPDPSILRVNDDYYIATSTFEWFPGVQIHHSRDLIHWKLITRPLKRLSQLNMIGNPSSCGIWAPCLSYDNGTFYLIYTDLKTRSEIFMDIHNYMVMSNDILGDWSEPIYLNSSGFDPSLFHDDNGKKWLVNMIWDYRKGKTPFGGIILQEFSLKEKRLIGEAINIFKGSSLGVTEGPHLYKKDGYYYLLTAEGGTGLKHAVTMARSQSITGPYEVDPLNPILTSRNDLKLELQKAGHASLVETQNGEWYLAHLCGRPLPSIGRCILGRETAIQKMTWTQDGWIRLEKDGNKPQNFVPAPNLPEHIWEEEPQRDDFDTKKLNIHFQSLRIPPDDDILSLDERKGFLRLYGRESISSWHHQALIARRQQAFCYTASTGVDFEPESFQQMAGLICLYDTRNLYYLHITRDEEAGKCLNIMTCIKGIFNTPLNQKIVIEEGKICHLKVHVEYDKMNFYYSIDGKEWTAIQPEFDASTLSDEFDEGGIDYHFTGAFVGICCQDLSGRRLPADFDYFEYLEN